MALSFPDCCCVCLQPAGTRLQIRMTYYETFSQGSQAFRLFVSAPICRRCLHKVNAHRLFAIGAGVLSILPGALIMYLAYEDFVHHLWFLAGPVVTLVLIVLSASSILREPAHKELKKDLWNYVVIVPSFRNLEYQRRFAEMNQAYLATLDEPY